MKRCAPIDRCESQAIGVAMLLLVAGVASATEPPSVRTFIEDRAADYRRQDPGVPAWPSTCDCIGIEFGFKDSSGYRPVRFRFADAVNYYGRNAEKQLAPARSSMALKGPVKERPDDDLTERNVQSETR